MTEWNRNFKYKKFYSRFQITFHCNIPNFVAKFRNLLRSSKVHFRIHKPVCKQSLCDWSLNSTKPIRCLVYKPACEFSKWTFELISNQFQNIAKNLESYTKKVEKAPVILGQPMEFVCESIIVIAVIASLAAQYVLMPAIHDNRKLLIVLRLLTIVNCRLCDKILRTKQSAIGSIKKFLNLTSLPSSKVHFRIRKPVSEQLIGFVFTAFVYKP